MRAPSEVLARARLALAGGWTPTPLSLDAAGKFCALTDEGLTKYCVADALELAAAGDFDAQQAAEDALSRRLGLDGFPMHVNEWASEWDSNCVPLRTHAQVLQLFARAHAIALAKESR